MKREKLISWKESIALILCMALFISSIQAAFGHYHAEAGNKKAVLNDIEIENSSFTLYGEDGMPIKINDSTQVREGQRVEFSIFWRLDNTDNRTEFSLDLQKYLKLQNLSISDAQGKLANLSDEVIGTFVIKDGILTYYLDNTIEHSGERVGGADFTGEVKTNLGPSADGTKIDIGIDGQKKEVIYDAQVQESSLNVNKSNNADGKSIYWKGDALYQDYTVSLYAYNGEVTLGKLTDTFGNGLTDMSDIKIKYAPSGLKLADSYTSITSLANALNGKVLDANQSIQFTYSMKLVDSADIAQMYPAKSYKNKVSVAYKTNKGNTGSKEAETEVYFNKPSINKSGAISEDGTKAIWTITINLNDMYKSGTALSDYIKKALEDTLGDDNTGKTISTIPVNKFTGSDGRYTYMYETDLSEDFISAVSKQSLKNTVTATIKDRDYTATGYVGKEGKTWIYKEATDYDESSKTITWKVTLADIPKNLTDFSLMDTIPYNWDHNRFGDHVLMDTISIKPEGGAKVNVVNGGKVVANNYVTKYEYGKMTFDNNALKKLAGKSVEVYYQSKITDADINHLQYNNEVQATFKENGRDVTEQASAVWMKQNAVNKEGSTINEKNGIQYKVTLDMGDIGELKAGQSVVLTDTVSKDMRLDKGSVKLSAAWKYNDYYKEPVSDFPGKVDVAQSGNVITFSLKTTQAVIDYINAGLSAGKPKLTVFIEYATYLSNDAAVELISGNSSKKYSNHVEGKYRGKLVGEDQTENQLTPQKVLRKSYVYDKTTAPNVEYSIEINPEGYDLSDGDTLTLEDEIGSALVHDLNSIKLEKKSGNTWITLQNKIDYRFSYSPSARTITLTVPDATPLRLSYAAKVVAHTDRYDQSNNEKLTSENAYNTIRLKGSQGNATSDNEALNTFAITPSVWADGESVTITKFWNDEDGSFNVLPGAVFSLYRVAYNNSTGQFGAETLDRDDIKVNRFGIFMLSKLKLDQVYALYEKTAPEGFERLEKPYYFVIPGSSGVTFKGVNKISYGYPLRIENKKKVENSGKLVIKKTIKGEVTREDAELALTFTVTDKATNMATEYTLKNFDYDAKKEEYTLELPRSVGDYVVEETYYDVAGCTTESVSYTINGGAATKSNRASATVQKGKDTVVAFEDEYKRTSTSGNGSLIITKTIEGAVTDEEAEKTLQFRITNNTTGQETNVGLLQFDYNKNTGVYTYKLPAAPGGYTVEETIYNVSGFILQSVTYRVNGGTEHKGTSVAADVSLGKDTQVAFKDSYIKNVFSDIIKVTPNPTKQAAVTNKPTNTPAPQKTAQVKKTEAPKKTAQAKKTPAPAKKTPAPAKKTPKPTKKTPKPVKKTPAPTKKKKTTKTKSAKTKVTKKPTKTTTPTPKKKTTVKLTSTPKKSKRTIRTNTAIRTGTPHITPKTGDETRILFYLDLSLMGLSALGIAVIARRMRKRKAMWRVL